MLVPYLLVPHHSFTLVHKAPLLLCFVMGNISVCYGCKQKYPKPPTPPNDICVRHKEWREHFPPGSSTSSSRHGNVYYHCNVLCIQAKCPFFESSMLVITAEVAAQLLPIHTEYLAAYMDCVSNILTSLLLTIPRVHFLLCVIEI